MYVDHLPRVSQIVENTFPFDGERFEKWLKEKKVSLSDYMEEASVGGTYVHNAIEKECKREEREKDGKWEPFVQQALAFLEDWEVEENELYVRTELFQGTIDLIARRKKDGERFVLDWKTYGLAKDRWGLRGAYRKPYDKLKKARLQLSLYAYATGIGNIAVIELTPTSFHFHELKKESDGFVEQAIQRWYDDGGHVPLVHHLTPESGEPLVEAEERRDKEGEGS